MEEKIEISILLNLYGNLLTETQKRYTDLYYNDDLSLSEIGEIEHITRQAVRTIIVKSKKKLYEYEKILQFMNKEKQIKNILKKLRATDLSCSQQDEINKIDNKLSF